MGSEERRPSLEAPSLGFRKRKKSPPAPSAEPAPPEPAPVDAAQVASDGEGPTEAEHTAPVALPEQPAAAAHIDPPLAEPAQEGPTPTQPTAQVAVETEAKSPRAERPALGPINGHLAAAIAGVVVGAFLVAATLGGLQACESVRGTTSCGGGPGFFLLLLIVVLGVVIGALVLRAAQVPSAGSISFLAVALVSVASLLFLFDVLDEAGGAVAVGLITVAAYLLAHWVTVRYIDAAV